MGRPKQTHCKNGHEFTDNNVYVSKGKRICKICYGNRRKKWMPENYNRDTMRTWRANNPKKDSVNRRDRDLRKKFGIGTEQYEALLKSQNGVCAICDGKCKTGHALAVDHCHKTNKIRGLLCMTCNTRIGRHDDNIARIERELAYLKAHS